MVCVQSDMSRDVSFHLVGHECDGTQSCQCQHCLFLSSPSFRLSRSSIPFLSLVSRRHGNSPCLAVLSPHRCRHIQERLQVPKINFNNVSPAEEPRQPQPQSHLALRQRRLRRHQQNRLRHPSRSLPPHSRTIAYICRPRHHSLKAIALSASAPPALAPNDPESSILLPPLSFSPFSAPPHHTQVKLDDRPIQERLAVLEIKSGNVPLAEEPKQPQSQRAQRQKRLRRHRHWQNHPRIPSRSPPAHSRTIAHACLWHLK